MSIADSITAVLLLSSAIFALLASLGLWRFDDVFSRIHASTKAATLGVLLVVVAAALQVDAWGDGMRLLLAATLQFISAPVGGHMLGRAAYWAGPGVTRHTAIDQLASSRDRFDGEITRDPRTFRNVREGVDE